MRDPIVEEVRLIRAEIAAEHGNDLHRIFEDARARQGADGRKVVNFDLNRKESSTVNSPANFRRHAGT
jgi:hypothetical protein